MDSKKILLALVVGILSVTLFVYRAEFLTFIMHLEMLRDDRPFFIAGVLIGLKSAAAVVGFPGTPLTLLSGSLLGHVWGTLVALVGNTIGATLAFMLSRYLFQDFVQRKMSADYPRLEAYAQRLETHGLSTVITLRLIPLFPFNALNFLLGASTIPLTKYVLGSFIGMIPGTFLFVYFGESLRMLNGLNIVLALIGIIGLTYIGRLYERHR